MVFLLCSITALASRGFSHSTDLVLRVWLFPNVLWTTIVSSQRDMGVDLGGESLGEAGFGVPHRLLQALDRGDGRVLRLGAGLEEERPASVHRRDEGVEFHPAAGGSVVGFVKRLLRNYLDPSAHALLPRLEVGERTPLFLIPGREPRYSWYVRIARGRPIESALTGVARLEAKAARGLEEAQALADLSAREMHRFASDATHDPRAPQNLFPIGGLEARLKHLLGDAFVVRRAIETQLHSEVTA